MQFMRSYSTFTPAGRGLWLSRKKWQTGAPIRAGRAGRLLDPPQFGAAAVVHQANHAFGAGDVVGKFHTTGVHAAKHAAHAVLADEVAIAGESRRHPATAASLSASPATQATRASVNVVRRVIK